ncbi:hypothetical protein P9616_gp53 [Escherichia phage CEC_Kaz_2018]|uniref:Uncharacterized protein n=1 Tax=Escherichia phage CEC_Kaz_2018 TaxID=2565596 RepID=A0A4P8EXR0_9CAUD|nr:hypothetical protein P9616_gp53 [Escherichia phage CEC_Kaz_2018]QCO71649.1 hypothetical protein [Escherichia phage CEC_Kaz_2018]
MVLGEYPQVCIVVETCVYVYPKNKSATLCQFYTKTIDETEETEQ